MRSSWRTSVAGERSFALGASLADRYPYAYDFEESLRNPELSPGPDRDRVLENRHREVNGTLRTLTVGAGMGLSRAISLGVGLNYAFGKRQEIRSVRSFVDDRESSRLEENFDLSGLNITLGGQVVFSRRVALGYLRH